MSEMNSERQFAPDCMSQMSGNSPETLKSDILMNVHHVCGVTKDAGRYLESICLHKMESALF